LRVKGDVQRGEISLPAAAGRIAHLAGSLPVQKNQSACGLAYQDVLGTQIRMKEARLMEMSQSLCKQTNESVAGRRIQPRKVTAAIDGIGLGTKQHKGLSATILAGRNQFRTGPANSLRAPDELGFPHGLGNHTVPVPPVHHPLLPDQAMLSLQDGIDRPAVACDRHPCHVAIGMTAKDGTRHGKEIFGRDQAGIPQEPFVSGVDC
jgi:hypothetical protein